MALSRRQFIRASAASGALLLARPARSLAGLLGPDAATSAGRQSKPAPGLCLAHADLHNHTLLSDGNGDADAAFASMRASGLDVAALTDHSTVNKPAGDPTKHTDDSCNDCRKVKGIDEADWALLAAAAEGANKNGSFVAIRGFEWSSPNLGHMNVWFSETWTDPLSCGAVGAGTTASVLMHEYQMQDDVPAPKIDPAAEAMVNDALRTIPEGQVAMAGFYRWLASASDTPVTGGGVDGIVGFNHPGREAGRFGYFAYDDAIADRVVSIEMFNRNEDYLIHEEDVVVPGADAPPITVETPVDRADGGWVVLRITDPSQPAAEGHRASSSTAPPVAPSPTRARSTWAAAPRSARCQRRRRRSACRTRPRSGRTHTRTSRPTPPVVRASRAAPRSRAGRAGAGGSRR